MKKKNYYLTCSTKALVNICVKDEEKIKKTINLTWSTKVLAL
jgi:hypothetical protein